MATSPVFASAFKVARVRNNAAANTASDGSGTVAIFQDDTGAADYSAPSAGARVDRITIINSQATAAASSAMGTEPMTTSGAAGLNYPPVIDRGCDQWVSQVC